MFIGCFLIEKQKSRLRLSKFLIDQKLRKLNLLMLKREKINIMANQPAGRSKITADSLLSAAKKGNVSPVYLITGSDEVCREQFFQKLI